MEKKKLTKNPNKEEIELNPHNIVPKNKKRTNILLGIFSFIFLSTIILLTYFGWYLQSFSQSAETTSKEVMASIKKGISSNPFENQEEINLLLLGKDNYGVGRDESSLTDTIILLSIQKSGRISIIPIPRDLWIDPLKSKINALYYYGEESEDITGSDLVSMSIEEISGLSIDHSIVLNLNLLEKVIDAIDGISVDVKNSFVDEKFPNSDVAPDIFPVELRYKTVSFQAGIQQMDGKTAIEYIRSRQSTNENENTDNARSVRQEEVIKSIINKISSRNIYSNPEIMGKIYYHWKNNTKTSISDDFILSVGKHLLGQEITYKTLSIPVQDINQKGILYNPPVYIYKQWVYLPHDESWQELQEFIQLNLHPNP